MDTGFPRAGIVQDGPEAARQPVFWGVAMALTTKRVVRRITARQKVVMSWWTSLPAPRPDYITAFALTRALKSPMRRMGAALHALGWRRLVRRVHGRKVTLWLPPGSPITKRPRGRPRLHPLP